MGGGSRSKCLWAFLLLGLLTFGCFFEVFAVSEAEEESGEAPVVAAEDAEADVVAPEEVEALGPAPGVQTVIIFPKNPDKLIPAGAPTKVLIGFENGGSEPLKVTLIEGALHYPPDWSMRIQNFTGVALHDAFVTPGSQYSFGFEFVTFRNLQPRDFGLSVVLFSESVDADLKSQYMNLVYNGTVEVVEASGWLNGESFFLLVLALGLMSLLGNLLWTQLQKLTRRRGKKKVETGTRSSSAENEWLKGTSADPKPKKKNL